MTHHDHVERVKKLAKQASDWEGQTDPYAAKDDDLGIDIGAIAARDGAAAGDKYLTPVEGAVCTCQTCGIVNTRLRAALRARGWSHSAVHHVRIEGYDFRGGCDPYLAVAKVDGDEVHRAYRDLVELLDDDVLIQVEKALRRRLC